MFFPEYVVPRRARERLGGNRSATRPLASIGLHLVMVLLSLSWVACSPNRGTIGAVLGRQSDGRLFLRDVPPKLAAHQKGLRPGDEVLLIEGRDVRQMPPEEVHRHLSGEVGASVKLTLIRGDDVVRSTLERTPATRMPRTRIR